MVCFKIFRYKQKHTGFFPNSSHMSMKMLTSIYRAKKKKKYFWSIVKTLQGLYCGVVRGNGEQTKSPASNSWQPFLLHLSHQSTVTCYIWHSASICWNTELTETFFISIESQGCSEYSIVTTGKRWERFRPPPYPECKTSNMHRSKRKVLTSHR